MKDKEKQIEEMAKRIHIATDLYYIECIKIATYLFEKDNCRIIDKDQVIVSKSEYERLIYVEGELQEMNADYYNELKELKDSLKDSVVLTREKYEELKRKRKYILANRVYSDATLKSWVKEDLIEHIRILEHNWASAEESLNIQAKNFKTLLEQVSKEKAERIINFMKAFFDSWEDTDRVSKLTMIGYLKAVAREFEVEIKE